MLRELFTGAGLSVKQRNHIESAVHPPVPYLREVALVSEQTPDWTKFHPALASRDGEWEKFIPRGFGVGCGLERTSGFGSHRPGLAFI